MLKSNIFLAAAFIGLTPIVRAAERGAESRPTPVQLAFLTLPIAEAGTPVTPAAVAVGADGTVVFADRAQRRVEALDMTGERRTLAGPGEIEEPVALAIRPDGTILAADAVWGRVIAIAPGGLVSAFARGLARPVALALDATGRLWIADEGRRELVIVAPGGARNNLAWPRPRRATALAAIPGQSDVLALDGASGEILRVRDDGEWTVVARGPGGSRTLAAAADGTLFIADRDGHSVRAIPPSGIIAEIAEAPAAPGFVDGAPGRVRFAAPSGLAWDERRGWLLVADAANGALRLGVPALPDRAMIDSAHGAVGRPVQLGSAPRSASRWHWRVIERPAGSAAELSDASAAEPSFVPDLKGRYRFELRAISDRPSKDGDGRGGEIAAASVTEVGIDASCPTLLTSPADRAVCTGLSTAFTATASQSLPGATAQWLKNGAAVSGATALVHSIPSVGALDEGSYTLLLGDACGTAVTTPARLVVGAFPPEPVGSSVRALKSGANIQLNWTDIPHATGYAVFESATPGGAFTTQIGTAASGSAGLLRTAPPAAAYWLVAPTNACGTGPKGSCARAITPAALPDATLAVPYSQTLTAGGAGGSPVWSVASGALPPWMTLNGGTGQLSGTPSAGGIHSFVIKAVDASGCVAWRHFVVTTCCQGPSVMGVTSAAANGSHAAGATLPVSITFTSPVFVTGSPKLRLETGATDRDAVYAAGSGTNTLRFDYVIQAGDSAADLDYLSTGALSASGGTIRDGSNVDAVLALPAPGAPGSLGANKNLIVDGIAPAITIVAPTAAATAFSGSSPLTTLAGTAADDLGLASVSWHNAATAAAGTASGTADWSVPAIVLVPGDNLITVTATDNAGNTATDTLTMVFDTTPPTVFINTPTGGLFHYTNAFTLPALAGGAFDNGGSGVVSVTWFNAGNSSGGTAIGLSSWSASNLSLVPGNNQFTVAATDAAGNTATATLVVVRDNSPPGVMITAPTMNSSYFTNGPVLATLAGTASDPEAGLASVSWRNAANSTSGTATGLSNWSVPFINLVTGANLITVTATDAAGNTATDTLTVTRDIAPPTVTITAPTSGTTHTTTATPLTTLAGTATDAASGVVLVSWSNAATGGSGNATGTVNWSVASMPLLQGANLITVTALDAAGNTATDTLTVTLDTTPPTTTITSLILATVGGPVFQFSADEPATFYCRMDGGAFSICSSPKSYSGLTLGTTHTFSVYAVDGVGLTGNTAQRSWLVPLPNVSGGSPYTHNALARTLTLTTISLTTSAPHPSHPNPQATTRITYVQPGASVTLNVSGSYDFTGGSCPGCVTQFYIGIAGVAISGGGNLCLGSGVGLVTVNSSTTFTAPATPGVYTLNPLAGWDFSCNTSYAISPQFLPESIATLVVEP